jgi:lysophospholipase L1-like esterase
MQLKGTAGSKGISFLRSYDSTGDLLLQYDVPFTLTDSGGSTGNYIETPPGTVRLTVGVQSSSGVRAAGCEIRVIKDPARGDEPVPACDLTRYMRPFWRSDTIFNETVLLRTDGRSPAGGELLYKPDKVLSVTNFGLDTVYGLRKDYRIEGRKIRRVPGSSMRFRTDSSFDRVHDLAWYDLQSQWVTVTYTHHDTWTGPVPQYKGPLLSRTLERLRSGRPVSIVAYGMSITRGMDVSGYDSVRPYMPTYMDLFVRGLAKGFSGSRVTLYNAGLPGATVSWGAERAKDYVTPLHPDLTVIDFGMNDFWRMSPGEFRDSVKAIIRKIRSNDPAAEFILLVNMQFDPDYVLDSDSSKGFYTGNMAGYRKVLQEMEAPGIACLDMYSVSEAVYRRKKAKDCLVNPLHPNDYMARWYAQGLVALLVRENP